MVWLLVEWGGYRMKKRAVRREKNFVPVTELSAVLRKELPAEPVCEQDDLFLYRVAYDSSCENRMGNTLAEVLEFFEANRQSRFDFSMLLWEEEGRGSAPLTVIDRLKNRLFLQKERNTLFIDTEVNDHNQRNVFKQEVIRSRKKHFTGEPEAKEKIHFDSPLMFDLNDVLIAARDINKLEIDTGEVYASGPKKGQPKTTQGSLYGKLTNFINRLENELNDKRLDFLLGDKSKNITFEETLKQLIGYGENKSNISIIDLSGVPFDVLSITVSLISRILFEYGYYYKRFRYTQNPNEKLNNDVPLLLVYEEAHKYVPNSDLSRYRASKQSIERIAKEGRKYGVTLLLSSQRPSEISETIFAQCNNFLALRLTNPNDQNYVKRLLPDTSGNLVEKMPSLKAGECILVGDAVTIPSIVHIEECDPKPSSNDIPYLDLWKTEWKELNISAIKDEWVKI